MNVNIDYQHPLGTGGQRRSWKPWSPSRPPPPTLPAAKQLKRIVDLAPAGFSKVFFTNAGGGCQ
ncbi:hypothetical protein LNQ03_03500 [Klebsiella pneumoniae subsp. pneumoniae]|nr:hypothetical protein [Klebsiella pneumoniae subsp. pneumoniae]